VSPFTETIEPANIKPVSSIRATNRISDKSYTEAYTLANTQL
jgi:hypothetical protein